MKFIKLLFIALLFSCCNPRNIEPIEKYKGCILVEVYYPGRSTYSPTLLKNKDSVFVIDLLILDTKNLKPGDTIK